MKTFLCIPKSSDFHRSKLGWWRVPINSKELFRIRCFSPDLFAGRQVLFWFKNTLAMETAELTLTADLLMFNLLHLYTKSVTLFIKHFANHIKEIDYTGWRCFYEYISSNFTDTSGFMLTYSVFSLREIILNSKSVTSNYFKTLITWTTEPFQLVKQKTIPLAYFRWGKLLA